MKIFTKLCLTLLCIIAGVANANAQDKVYATFASPSGITWDATNMTFSWNSQWGNQLHNIGLPNGDLSSYETLVVDCEILEGDSYRFMFYANGKGTTAGGVTVVSTSGEHSYKLSEFSMDQAYLTDCSEICLSGNGPSGKVKVNSVYLVKAADPLGGYKDALKKSIAKGKQTNDIAYTVGSFFMLTNAISAGETALADAGATEESLTAASTAIDNAIAGLKLKSGYSELTAAMFLKYASVETPGEGTTAYPAFVMNEASDLPYGDASVGELNWADLTKYEKLIITTVGDIKPRLCLNRLVSGGQQAETQADSKMLDINPNSAFTWSTEKYLTAADGVYTLDLKQIVADYSFARLHCIKQQGWGPGVTVTGMYLYKYEPLAEDQMPQELTFPDYSEPVASYTTEWTADVEGKVWTLNGFNNQNNAWDYVACGRKKEATVATITSAPIFAEVKDVVLYVGERKNVEEATVIVLDEYGYAIDTVDVTDQFLAGYTEVQATPEERGYGYSYVITIKSVAGENGSTIINKVGLYGEDQYVNRPALLREAQAALTAEIEKAKALAESGKTYGLEDLQAAIAKAETTLAEATDADAVKAETAALQAAEKTFEEAVEPVVVINYFNGADGKYYLKNVASGLFWGAGNEWSTRGSLVQHPEFVTLKAQEGDAYIMESQVSNGSNRYYFGGDYMDGADAMKLTIVQQSAGEESIDLTAELFHKWDGISTDAQIAEENAYPTINIGTEQGAGATIYGNPSVQYLTYADLTGSEKIVIEGTAGLQLRVLLNRLEVGNGGGDSNGGALVEKNPVIGDDGKAEVDLTELEVAHVNAIKLGWGSPAGTITKIAAVKAGGAATYTIADGEKCFGYDGESTVLGKELAADNENALWQILTEDDMKATLNEATHEAPVDATFLILDPNFGRNNRYGKGLTSKANGNDKTADLEPAWTFEASNKDISGENTNFCVESWHATFTQAQTIENVPNGLYEMNVQGFYRNDNTQVTPALPYFYVNEQKRNFIEKTGAENSMADASKSFSAGLYKVEPVKVVVTDGTITLGAKNEEGLEYWCIWDNFELTYFGPATEDDIIATAITTVAPAVRQQTNAIYNLNGQKVQNLKKGLYIINGRKVVIK